MHHTCYVTVALICLAAFFAKPLHAVRVTVPSATVQGSPDQRVMEEFVSTMWGAGDVPWNSTNVFNSPPVCTWKGVSCDGNHRVIRIDFGGFSFGGTVDLTKLPSSLLDLLLNSNMFSGAVNLAHLPSSLEKLHLGINGFRGSVDFTNLPPSLQQLNLMVNTFSGPLNLTRLPSSLQVLNLGVNVFRDSVDLTMLPASLQQLAVASNALSGSVDLTQLPPSLQLLQLNLNKLSGSVDLTKLPSSLRHLSLRGNSGICGNVSWSNAYVQMLLPIFCHKEAARQYTCGKCP